MSDFPQIKGYLEVKRVFSQDFAKLPFSVSSVLTSPADLSGNALNKARVLNLGDLIPGDLRWELM